MKPILLLLMAGMSFSVPVKETYWMYSVMGRTWQILEGAKPNQVTPCNWTGMVVIVKSKKEPSDSIIIKSKILFTTIRNNYRYGKEDIEKDFYWEFLVRVRKQIQNRMEKEGYRFGYPLKLNQ